MTTPWLRTGETSLEDEELLLLDALFDQDCPPAALRRAGFSERFNLPAAHDLDDVALARTLMALARRGLVRLRDGDARVGLTPAGAALWDRERLPTWERYCADASYERDGGWELSVRSPSEPVARAFLAAASAHGLFAVDPQQGIDARWLDDVALVPWRRFRAVFELRARLVPGASARQVDWAAIQARRVWWRTINELCVELEWMLRR
ncbi:MAG: hypothetical protein R3A51_05660 [Nannocystaceae bacterium]|nr:hypothetical protein [Myxococcales bacterium]